MNLREQLLFSVTVTTSPRSEILTEIETYLKSKAVKPLTVVSINPEHVVMAQNDRHFLRRLNGATIHHPDGIGVVWAFKWLNNLQINQITGIDLMLDLIKIAEQNKYSIFLIGGSTENSNTAREFLTKKFPIVKFWNISGPRFVLNDHGESTELINFQSLAQQIKDHKTKLVFLAFGAPKQEYVIEKLAQELEKLNMSYDPLSIILMTVGGSFDMLSGKTPRAPLIVQKLHGEWFWRLIIEPKRIFRQYKLLIFIFMVLKQKFFGKR